MDIFENLEKKVFKKSFEDLEVKDLPTLDSFLTVLLFKISKENNDEKILVNIKNIIEEFKGDFEYTFNKIYGGYDMFYDQYYDSDINEIWNSVILIYDIKTFIEYNFSDEYYEPDDYPYHIWNVEELYEISEDDLFEEFIDETYPNLDDIMRIEIIPMNLTQWTKKTPYKILLYLND